MMIAHCAAASGSHQIERAGHPDGGRRAPEEDDRRVRVVAGARARARVHGDAVEHAEAEGAHDAVGGLPQVDRLAQRAHERDRGRRHDRDDHEGEQVTMNGPVRVLERRARAHEPRVASWTATALWKTTCRQLGACDASMLHVCTSCSITSVPRYSGIASCSAAKTTVMPCAFPRRRGVRMSRPPVALHSASVRTAETAPLARASTRARSPRRTRRSRRRSAPAAGTATRR